MTYLDYIAQSAEQQAAEHIRTQELQVYETPTLDAEDLPIVSQSCDRCGRSGPWYEAEDFSCPECNDRDYRIPPDEPAETYAVDDTRRHNLRDQAELDYCNGDVVEHNYCFVRRAGLTFARCLACNHEEVVDTRPARAC